MIVGDNASVLEGLVVDYAIFIGFRVMGEVVD